MEVVHGITSLGRERADAARLLALVREHWGIENGSHYRRDVTLGEDASRIRTGSAPQVMAALRNSGHPPGPGGRAQPRRRRPAGSATASPSALAFSASLNLNNRTALETVPGFPGYSS